MHGEKVDYYSSETRCSALLWRPDGTVGPAPAVVLCHGFRGIKEWALPDFAELFVARGYAVLAIDYRGFGESDGQRGRLVPLEQVDDIRAGLSYLAAQDFVDAARLALYGTSFGGANVVQAAADDDRVKAVVCQVGFGRIRRTWPGVYERFEQRLDDDRLQRAVTGVSATIDPGEILDDPQSNAAFAVAAERWPQLRQRFPLEAVERIFDFNPEDAVSRISPRAALFLGAAVDTAVPVEETTHLYEAAGEPKRLEVFDITHYEIYESPHRDRAVDLACEFFDEHLNAPTHDAEITA